MSFHPNEVQRRARLAAALLFLSFVFLVGSFFRTQVLQHAQYVLQSEENRLREVPLPAPRGVIYDRRGQIIAENLPGYSVSLWHRASIRCAPRSGACRGRSRSRRSRSTRRSGVSAARPTGPP